MDHTRVPPRRFSYDLLKEITDDFSEERKLGSGGYGKVYKGVLRDGETIAVKLLFDMPGLDDVQFKMEFNNLMCLQHDNIVRLVGYCHDTTQECVKYNGRMVVADKIHRALCFEYAHNGSLHENLPDEYNGHDWPTRYRIIKGICNGLKYLHQEHTPPMYHLDLKPANVLLDENMLPKIADFGLSRLFGQEQTKITKSSIGTCGYLPPEYIEQYVISNKFDIFSLGVVMIKVMTGPKGYSRYAEMSSREFVKLVHGNWRNRLQSGSMYEPEPYYEQVKTCLEIALSCVEADRHKRPSIRDIIDKMNETENKIRVSPPIEEYYSLASRYLSPLKGISNLRRFEYSELAIATERFSKDSTHGEGAFTAVYKRIIYAGENYKHEVAVKKINQITAETMDFPKLYMFSRVGHYNIVHPIGWCCRRKTRNFLDFMGLFRHQRVQLFLVYDWVPNGNLNYHLYHSEKILSWEKRHKIIRGIVSALTYLHSFQQCILHGDIKPSNILLDNNFIAKLAGLTLSRIARQNRACRYMDPQRMEDGPVKLLPHSDVYSLGIVLLEIACTDKSREQVWELYRRSAAKREVMMDAADRKLGGIFDRTQMARVIVLGLRCSHRDSEQRPNMEDAMKFLEKGIELPEIEYRVEQ